MANVGNTGYLTELDLRIWLRDHDPDANLLLDDLEFTPEEIRSAMTLTVDYWNEQPPYLGNLDVNTFPYRFALLKGTVANLLFIAAHRFRRNSLNYNVAGGSINDQEKHKLYDPVGQRLWSEYQRWVREHKQAVNAEGGWWCESG